MSSMCTSGSRRSPSASASALTSRRTVLKSPCGKQGSKISSTARSRREATRMSWTRSMSDVSSTFSACSNSSSARRRTMRAAASAYGSNGSTTMSAALATALEAKAHVQHGPLAQASSADLERLPELLGGRVEDDDAGRQQPHAAGVEGELIGDLGGGRGGQDADRALERRGVEDVADEAAQRGGAPADRDRAVGVRDLARVEARRSRARARPAARRARAGPSAGSGRPASRSRRGTTTTSARRRPTVPTAISVDPPPTSTTPTSPGSSRPSVCVAPRKASRASSSPSRISTGSVMPARNSSRLTAARMQAVATIRTRSAPASPASATCSATTRATSSIFSRGISACVPMRVKARRWSTSVRRPSFTSATSTRVVFVPMSTHAQTIPAPGEDAMMARA